MKKKLVGLILVAFMAFIISTGVAFGANETVKVPEPAVNYEAKQVDTEKEFQKKLDNLEMKINDVNRDIRNNENKYASIGLVLFLFGSFCALWAQNTGRNALGWFFGGAIFNFIAVLFLLKLNYEDKGGNRCD